MKKLILAVCNGNIPRSVIAELCLNNALRSEGADIEYVGVSRGLAGTCGSTPPDYKNLRGYPWEWKLTEPILKEIGVELPNSTVSVPVGLQIVEEAVLVLAMDRAVLTGKENSLVRQFPSYGFKMRLFAELDGTTADVPDCFGQRDPNYYRRSILMIDTIVKSRIKHLIALAEILKVQK